MSDTFRQEVPESGGRNNLARGPLKDTAVDSPLRVRSTGRPAPSLSDFADQFECLLNEKRDLTLLLSKAIDENAALNHLHEQAFAEFDCERIRLNSEIAELNSQLSGRLQSVLAAKQKLMREEFDRKFQELTLEVRQERNMYRKAIDEMKKQIASCICRAKNR